MKALTFFLLAMITTFFSFGQTASQSSPSTDPVSTRQPSAFLNSDRAELASAQTNSEYPEVDYRGRARQAVMSCARIKRQRTIGIIFTAIGAGLLSSGIAMTIAGNRAIDNDTYINSYGYYVTPPGDYALRNGGIACTILGLGSLALGIPNLVVGCVRYRKYCGGVFDRDRRSYLELHPGLNTMGLAMKF